MSVPFTSGLAAVGLAAVGCAAGATSPATTALLHELGPSRHHETMAVVA